MLGTFAPCQHIIVQIKKLQAPKKIIPSSNPCLVPFTPLPFLSFNKGKHAKGRRSACEPKW